MLKKIAITSDTELEHIFTVCFHAQSVALSWLSYWRKKHTVNNWIVKNVRQTDDLSLFFFCFKLDARPVFNLSICL